MHNVAPGEGRGEGASTLASIAANRHTEPARLSKEVSGELDWIVMKCLEKDRNRRYETASEIASDIDRNLLGEPVLAVPPSTLYRLRKLVSRHKAAVLAGCGIAAALILGAIISAREAVRASHAEVLAEGRLQHAETVTDFLVTSFQSPHPDRDGRAITVAEVLERAEKQLETDLQNQPLTQAALFAAIGKTWTGLGLNYQAIVPAQKAVDLYQKNLGETNPVTLESKLLLGVVYLNTGRTRDAARIFEEVSDSARRDPKTNHELILTAMHRLAITKQRTGERGQAIEMLEEVVKTRRRELGSSHAKTLASMQELGNAYLEADNLVKAIPLLEETVSTAQERLGPEKRQTLSSMIALGRVYHTAKRYDDAIRVYEKCLSAQRKSLGDDHPNTIVGSANLANAIRDRANADRDAGRIEKAERDLNDAIRGLVERGQFLAALALARLGTVEELDRFIQNVIPLDGTTASGGINRLVLGELQLVAGKPDVAVQTIRDAIAKGAQRDYAYKSLGWALIADGKPEDAKQALRHALTRLRQDNGEFSLADANPDELTAAYFLDLITQNEFAERVKNPKTLVCLPWFYIGQRQEIEGNPKSAIDAYTRCVELHREGPWIPTVYDLARWRLMKLQQNSTATAPQP